MAPARSRRSTRRSYTKPLSREKIAAAAIDVLRDEGQGALSMRKIAGLFGVDVAALYRHFANKEALLEEVGRMAAELAELELPEQGSWDDRFLALCQAIRRRIVEHPELGFYGGGSPWATPFIARANGLIATLLHEGGLRDDDLVRASQAVLHLVTSIAQSEVLARATPAEQNRQFARTVLEHLPEEVEKSWPRVSGATHWSIGFDDFFEYAVEKTRDALVSKPAGEAKRARS